MKQRLASTLLLIGTFLAAVTGTITAAGEETQTPFATAQITQAIVEAKIAEVKASSNMEEEAKTKLLKIYGEISSNLQTATKNRDSAQDFRKAAQTAPPQTRKLHDELNEGGAATQLGLGIDLSSPLSKIEQKLQKQKSDLAATRARQADLEQQLNKEENRPELIQSHLTEAKKQQSEAAGMLELPPLPEEGPALLLILIRFRQEKKG